RKILFVSHRSGANEIWVSDHDGANELQLTSGGWSETQAPRWSPDGSQIVFHARPDGPADIYTIPAGGGAPKRFTDDPADEWGPSWSGDGLWIYFGSMRTGRLEIWKKPLDGGAAVQMTRNGGGGPQESPDERYLYY